MHQIMRKLMKKRGGKYFNPTRKDVVKENNKNKRNKEDVKTLTFLNLLRVLKNKNLFCKVRASLAITSFSGQNGISSIYFWLTPFRYIVGEQKENPFKSCMNHRNLLEVMDNFINENPRIQKCDDEDAKLQIYITECINIILHSCLERFIGKDNMKMLEEIGQETFDMTCTKIFGEGFEDKTASMMPPQQQIFDVEAIKEMIKAKSPDSVNVDEASLNNFIRMFKEAAMERTRRRNLEEADTSRYIYDIDYNYNSQYGYFDDSPFLINIK